MISAKMMAKAGCTPPFRIEQKQPITMYGHSGALRRNTRLMGMLGASSCKRANSCMGVFWYEYMNEINVNMQNVKNKESA